jgi:CheY-like chemotaxis protein
MRLLSLVPNGYLPRNVATRAHILVVEDDADCREAVSEYLELHGYDVSRAADGVEALALLRSARAVPDVAIVDLKMPRMDGEQLVAVMTRDPRLAAVRVIAVSGALERLAPRGAAVILHKPFPPDALLRTVVQVLEPANAPVVAVAVAGARGK